MKFDTDLTQPFSKRRFLTPDETSAIKWWFAGIKDCNNMIPDNVFNDMADIESQFNKDSKLSDDQLKYVQDIYERYS